MAEREVFGSRIEFAGRGKIKITRGGTSITIGEKAAPRKISDNLSFPVGTLDSLRPVLREFFSTVSDEEAYWAEIEARGVMDPQKAVNKLRRAGNGYIDVARALVMSDAVVNENISWGRLDQSQIDAKIAQVAAKILPFYRNRPTKSK